MCTAPFGSTRAWKYSILHHERCLLYSSKARAASFCYILLPPSNSNNVSGLRSVEIRQQKICEFGADVRWKSRWTEAKRGILAKSATKKRKGQRLLRGVGNGIQSRSRRTRLISTRKELRDISVSTIRRVQSISAHIALRASRSNP